jgi:hypothetical protein
MEIAPEMLRWIWATRPEDLTPNFFPQRLPRTREIRQLGEAGDEEHRA